MSTGVRYKTLIAQSLFSVAKRTTSDMSTVKKLNQKKKETNSVPTTFSCEVPNNCRLCKLYMSLTVLQKIP